MLRKNQLPKKLTIGEKLKLCDASWSILFPDYWVIYRRTASYVNIATFTVLDSTDDQYILTCMDIVPETGRLVIPVSLKATVNLRQIHMAIVLSEKYKKT